MDTVTKYESSNYFKNKITFLNVILTVMVVVLHAKTPERFGLPMDWSNPFIYFITIFNRAAVPSFFFISGLLLFKGYTKDTLPRKLKSRFWTLVIPYLLWNTLYAIFYYTITRVPLIADRMNMGISLSSPIEFVKAILLSKQSDLWFVGDLIIYTAVSPLILVLTRKKYLSQILLALSILLLLFTSPEYMSIFHWAPMYLSGALFGSDFHKITQSNKLQSHKNRIIVVAGLLFASSLVYALLTECLYLYELVSPIAIWMFVDVLFGNRIASFKKKQWMNYTFFIFCSHHFIENIIEKFFVLAFEPTIFVLNAVYIITPFITIGIIVIICNIIKGTHIYKLMCGNR